MLHTSEGMAVLRREKEMSLEIIVGEIGNALLGLLGGIAAYNMVYMVYDFVTSF